MAKTEAQITEDHFRGLPMILDMARPTDIFEFAERMDGNLFLVKGAILSLFRLGYIRRDEAGVYYWPLTMRRSNAVQVAA